MPPRFNGVVSAGISALFFIVFRLSQMVGGERSAPPASLSRFCCSVCLCCCRAFPNFPSASLQSSFASSAAPERQPSSRALSLASSSTRRSWFLCRGIQPVLASCANTETCVFFGAGSIFGSWCTSRLLRVSSALRSKFWRAYSAGFFPRVDALVFVSSSLFSCLVLLFTLSASSLFETHRFRLV